MSNIPNQFDPDELKLSKQFVIEMCDKIIKRWKENGTSTKYILGLYTFKAGLKVTPDDTFNYVWRMLVKFINYLMLENSKAHARSLGEKWVNVLDLVKQEADNGVFDF